jgi:hypothetical protein
MRNSHDESPGATFCRSAISTIKFDFSLNADACFLGIVADVSEPNKARLSRLAS